MAGSESFLDLKDFAIERMLYLSYSDQETYPP
jgi:hypothetical protein